MAQAQVRIEVDAGITVEVIQPGTSAPEIAALQAQVADLTAKVDAARTYINKVQAADVADDAERAATLATLG